MQSYSVSRAITISVCMVALLWVIQSAGVLFDLPLGRLGIVPLETGRWYGIFSAPLVHGSYEHLFNNTMPLLVLGSALVYGYPKSRIRVLLACWLASGIGVWVFGRDAVHLGASGVSHGLFFFLFFVAIFRRDGRSVGLMMIAFFLYGGMVMSIFPRDPAISFESHFFGALGGVVSAILWWRRDPKPMLKRYSWETDGGDDPLIGDLWQQKLSPQNSTDAEGDNRHHGKS
ncbi:rhomboid family intramembrane serine protease [Alteromonas aestuariivivens]|nr:rhomboid family intramembrane serine protease [Alteromonas aestuariivivens]